MFSHLFTGPPLLYKILSSYSIQICIHSCVSSAYLSYLLQSDSPGAFLSFCIALQSFTLLHLALMWTNVDLEGPRVLVEGVLPAIKTIGGFPAKGFYQKVESKFQVARQLPEIQGF